MIHPRWLLVLATVSVAPLACKDESPCDESEVSIGTGCFPPPEVGGAGAGPEASFFGTPCETNDDCGGDAPVCDNVQFNYCLQIECQEGEANEGACPSGWSCFKYQDNPSACVKF